MSPFSQRRRSGARTLVQTRAARAPQRTPCPRRKPPRRGRRPRGSANAAVRFIRWSKNLLSVFRPYRVRLSSMAAQASLAPPGHRRPALRPPPPLLMALRPWASRSAHVTARAPAPRTTRHVHELGDGTARNSKAGCRVPQHVHGADERRVRHAGHLLPPRPPFEPPARAHAFADVRRCAVAGNFSFASRIDDAPPVAGPTQVSKLRA